MDLRELGYFVAVFDERSVSAAARRCFVSQPSVSEALANLEHELGTRLFVRHRKGATPTAAAEQLYPRARGLITEASSLKTLFRAAPPARRKLTVGLMRSLAIDHARDLLARMTKDAPFDLVLVNEDEACDVRVISRSLRTEGEVFLPLWEERYVVAMPRKHSLASQPSVRASELPGHRLIARCHCENAKRFVGKTESRFEIAAVAPTEEWAVALVAAGVGIAIIPEGSATKRDDVVVRPIRDVHAKRQVGLAYGAKSPSADVQRLVDSLSSKRLRRRK